MLGAVSQRGLLVFVEKLGHSDHLKRRLRFKNAQPILVGRDFLR